MSFLKLFVVLAVLTASLAVEARSLPKKVDMFGAGADPKVCVPGYWSEALDTADQRIYYSSLSPQVTFEQLSGLVASTHKHVYSYSEARRTWLYPCVDRHSDGQIRGVYTNLTLSAPALLVNGGGGGNDNKYNCEHSVPQSWFRSQTPMVSDMHHLFSAQVTCNGFRSSYVFGTGDHTVKHLEGCGDLLASAGNSQSFFTPFSATGRGAVARASLYFMLRYPNEKVAVNNIKVGFKTLLLWASQNPPTLWEKHRNAAVFRAQGNRNPFIDFPDLPGQLDWSSIVN